MIPRPESFPKSFARIFQWSRSRLRDSSKLPEGLHPLIAITDFACRLVATSRAARQSSADCCSNFGTRGRRLKSLSSWHRLLTLCFDLLIQCSKRFNHPSGRWRVAIVTIPKECRPETEFFASILQGKSALSHHSPLLWRTIDLVSMKRLVGPIFRHNRLSLRSHHMYSGGTHLLQGIFGDTYGDALYRTYVRRPATRCKFDA